MRRSLAIFILCMACLLLSIASIFYHVKKIGKEYRKEEKIYTLLSKILVEDLFVDEQGNELEQITTIKGELLRVELPKEVIDSVFDTEVIKKNMSRNIAQEMESFLAREEKDKISWSSDAILNFFQENMKAIVTELQGKHIPKSELLTEEKQKEILIKMEVVAPQMEEEIKELAPILEEKILDSKQYPKIEKIKLGLEKLGEGSRFLYSSSFSILLFLTSIGCIGIILLLCHSPYRYLKFFGFSCFINAVFFFCCMLVVTRMNVYVKELPPIIEDLSVTILEDINHFLKDLFGLYFILFFIFILLNIIIHKVVDGRVEKKLNSI